MRPSLLDLAEADLQTPRGTMPEKKSTRSITGEYAACTVRAMRTGCEANDQHTRFWVAESGYGPAPVFLISICPALDARHFLTPFHQALTFATGNNF